MSNSDNRNRSAGMAYLAIALFLFISWGLYVGEMNFAYWNVSLLVLVGIVNKYFNTK